MNYDITILFVALLAILQVPATFFVGFRRIETKILISDGGDQTLLRRIRAHANFTETVPITLLAMAAADVAGAPDVVLWAGGSALLIGRTMHYFTIALTKGDSLLRAAGMLLTFAAMLTFSGFALMQVWPS
ncbi:MAG: MAPEG family protein [Hyphomicrobiales bacterium]|nr:MAPEG family protein [Hyphomicrobiales bacterium]